MNSFYKNNNEIRNKNIYIDSTFISNSKGSEFVNTNPMYRKKKVTKISSLCDDNKIGKLIQSAIIRAKDCATDPICYHTTGQGVGNLNLSACFSCSLLPETSCELFNSFLDRKLLIDEKFGYFKQINDL